MGVALFDFISSDFPFSSCAPNFEDIDITIKSIKWRLGPIKLLLGFLFFGLGPSFLVSITCGKRELVGEGVQGNCLEFSEWFW